MLTYVERTLFILSSTAATVRFAMLLSKAITVFGSQDEANKWLKSPQFGLGGAVPLDFAKSEVGAREVEKLLGRIEYGVYT